MKKAIFLALAVGCSGATPEHAHAPQAETSKLESRLREEYARAVPQAKGAVVIGVYDGTKTLVVSFGDADGDTTFEIGSVTKPMTGVLLAEEVNRGSLALADEAERFLPGTRLPRGAGEPIRLEHLATFTSGLPFMPANWIPVDRGTYTPEMWREFLGTYALAEAPGTSFAYGNVGFGVLGDVLAAREEKSLGALMRERIFEPLHMRHSWLLDERPANARVAIGHDDQGAEVPLRFDKPLQAGCCAVESTANDLLAFVRAPLDATTPPELARAFDLAMAPRRHAGGNYSDRDVGLGWFVERSDALHLATGLMRGYRTGVALDRARRAAAVVLAADAAFPSEQLAREALQAVLVERDHPAVTTLTALPPCAVHADVRWDTGVALVGWCAPAEAAPGETVTIRYFYEASKPLDADWTVFVHGDVEPFDLAARVHGDHAPARPTSDWPTGVVVEDRVTLALAKDQPRGALTLWSGFYRGPRMHLTTRGAATDGRDRARGPMLTVR